MGDLRFLAADAAREALAALREASHGEALYGFCLTIGSGPPGVSAAANTEAALGRTAERFAADDYGDAAALAANTPGSLRWRTAEWAYRAPTGEALADLDREVAALIGAADDPDEAREAVTRSFVGALRDLGREDAFGWGPERDAIVVLIETGDPADTLELARDVNPAVPFARLQAGLSPA
jgi:hypothetical protein